ncbi:MAG: MFS transporter, partial [Planctomycetota bacterium]
MLTNRNYVSLLAVQFFGAMNDNVLKGVLTFMVIDGVWSGHLGPGGQAIIGVCFTLPFIALSGYAGQIADRFSKQTLTRWLKWSEVPIAVTAGFGFAIGSLWITLFALILLTCQSAFFGPAKYGMIPELVPPQLLSKANGTINMMTNLAVIIGTLIAGSVSDRFWPQNGAPGWGSLPLIAMTIIAVLGLVSAQTLQRVQGGDRNIRWQLNPFKTYIETIIAMSMTRLLMVMMAWGFFYLLAGIALFIIPEYTTVMKIDRTAASVLMGVLGISVGVGCALAGWISGDSIRPRMVVFGAVGLTLFFALLGLVDPPIINGNSMRAVATSNVSWFIFGAGVSAGFYIVPLQALLQQLSPKDARGRFLGTANAVSFASMTLAAAVYYAGASFFIDAPHRFFVVNAFL